MALILSVNGYGEVENESMEITVNEAQEDIMTGDMKMNVDGTLLADAPLTVSITPLVPKVAWQMNFAVAVNAKQETERPVRLLIILRVV